MDMGGMNMNSNNTTANMASMDGMQMTFSRFSSYSLSLLFGTWIITEKWQFFLSWVAVFLASMFYHLLKFLVCSLDCVMILELENISKEKSKGLDVVTSDSTSALLLRPSGWIIIKSLHSLLTSLQYGLSLMLMLVSYD